MTGHQIRELRDALRLSTPGFAKLVGVSVSTLRRWEFHGEREVLLAGRTKEMLMVIHAQVHEQGVDASNWSGRYSSRESE